VVFYFRRAQGAPRIRLRANPGTPEFEVEYLAALAGTVGAERKRTINSGTLRWLWERYRETTAWTRLSLATRKQRENIMLHVLEKSGEKAYASVKRADIIASRDAKKGTPSAARNFLDTMRGLFEWAVDAQHVTGDPTAGVKAPERPETGGFKPWTEEEVQAYENRWPIGTKERVWLDLLLYTGLRRGDAARVGKQHVRRGEIALTTEKTDTPVTIPILPILQKTLDAGPTGDLTFIVGTRGRPFTKESFGNAFSVAAREAGIPKSAHGLRKVAAERCAYNGATVAQMNAIFGWAGYKMAMHYIEKAERARLSRGAIEKMLPTQNAE
jgi:integrase